MKKHTTSPNLQHRKSLFRRLLDADAAIQRQVESSVRYDDSISSKHPGIDKAHKRTAAVGVSSIVAGVILLGMGISLALMVLNTPQESLAGFVRPAVLLCIASGIALVYTGVLLNRFKMLGYKILQIMAATSVLLAVLMVYPIVFIVTMDSMSFLGTMLLVAIPLVYIIFSYFFLRSTNAPRILKK